MKRNGSVLVTGAAGFGGSHLVEHLLEHGEHVVALDHPQARPEHLAAVRDRIEYLACDLAGGDAEAIRAALGGREFKEVYHLAGLASVRRSFGEMRRTLEVNALATLNLLGALLRQGTPPRLLLVGSAEQYGIGPAGEAGFTEDAAQQPVSPYALSKVWQEALGGFYSRTERWPILMTRTFNHTGPRQGPDFVCADFARQIARIELRLDEPVLRVGNLAAARDFLDVRDVVAAYRLVLERGAAGSAYNVCSGRVVEHRRPAADSAGARGHQDQGRGRGRAAPPGRHSRVARRPGPARPGNGLGTATRHGDHAERPARVLAQAHRRRESASRRLLAQGGLLAVSFEDVGDGADRGAGGAVFPGQPGQRPAGGLA